MTGYAGLADAFAGEVAARLPALRAAVARLPDGVGEAITHAHALASSAAVVGETLASRAARTCEQLLLPYESAQVPQEVMAAVAVEAGTVAVLLSPWLR